MADMVASVPELTKRSFSIDGTAEIDELGEVGLGRRGCAEAGADCAAARWMASTTGGKAWPRIIGPQEPK